MFLEDGGWREAVRAATQMYYQSFAKTPSQEPIKRREHWYNTSK